MSSKFGSPTARRLDVTVRRRKAERRAQREAARRAGIPETFPPYHPHQPYKASGRDHRTFYYVKVQTGFVVGLLLIISLLQSPFYAGAGVFEVDLAQQEIITMEDIQQTRQDLPPPPPPRPPVPIEVADDVVLDDEELNLDATLDIDEFIADIPPPPPPPEVNDEEIEPEIFIVVEEQPVMIGGLAALSKALRYPEMARKAQVEGRVTVQFVVDENGDVQDPFVLRGIGAGCDEEALRVIKLMKFKPGRQRGRAVKVQLATMITFQLTDN
jgi:protein TonB